jgi:hypothetical protein
MKRGALVLLVLLLATAPSTGALELRLTAGMPEQLPYVYPDLRLVLKNPSPLPAFFPKNGFYVHTSIETGDGWSDCRPRVLSMPPTSRKIEWEEVPSGGLRAVPVPASQCLCKEKSSSQQCKDWTENPGQYRLKVTLTLYPGVASDDAPAGALTGKLESNAVEIRVKQPEGLDAEAIAWAKGSPMTVEVLKAFPASEYAALLWYGNVRLDGADPLNTRALVDRGQYPGPNSVPDPDVEGKWRSLDSEGVARWQVEWGQRVLREHPGFPYRDEVKLIVALGQISLGEKDQGLRTVRELAQKEHAAVGPWSQMFLKTTNERPGS